MSNFGSLSERFNGIIIHLVCEGIGGVFAQMTEKCEVIEYYRMEVYLCWCICIYGLFRIIRGVSVHYGFFPLFSIRQNPKPNEEGRKKTIWENKLKIFLENLIISTKTIGKISAKVNEGEEIKKLFKKKLFNYLRKS